MKTARRLLPAAMGLALVGALLTGCESSDPAAQTDWKITVYASPASVDLIEDPTGTVNLRAQVVDKNGLAQTGIGVKFAASSGTLESASAARTTDANGEAFDVLHTTVESSVTATSGTITSTAVPIEVLQANRPTAEISVTPQSAGRVAQNVNFNSSDSTAEDDATIELSEWEIYSNVSEPGVEYFFSSSGTTPVVKRFNLPQTFSSVRLRVRDNHGRYSEWVQETNYEITDNLAPTARISSPNSQVGTVTNEFGYACQVFMRADGSADHASEISLGGKVAAYDWYWGDGKFTRKLEGVTQADHVYNAPSDTPYTVTLAVWDNGASFNCPAPSLTGDPKANCASRKQSLTSVTATVTCPAAP